MKIKINNRHSRENGNPVNINSTEQTILSTHETKILIATKYFGDVIKIARKRKNITRKKLAENLGVSRRKMLQFENGHQIIPKHILLKLFTYGIR